MSYGIYLCLLFTINGAVTGKPHVGLDLSAALDKTLCPMVVRYDVDADRIPRLIKTLECETSPEEMCAAGAGERAAQCCRLQNADSLVFKCAQVIDHVLVSSKDLSRNYTIPVPIGCSCIAQEASHAQDAY